MKTQSPTRRVIIKFAVITMIITMIIEIERVTQNAISLENVFHISILRNWTANEKEPASPKSSSVCLRSCRNWTPSVDSSSMRFTWIRALNPASFLFFMYGEEPESANQSACKDDPSVVSSSSFSFSVSVQIRSTLRSYPTLSRASSKHG